jgi:hypothetical protein
MDTAEACVYTFDEADFSPELNCHYSYEKCNNDNRQHFHCSESSTSSFRFHRCNDSGFITFFLTSVCGHLQGNSEFTKKFNIPASFVTLRCKGSPRQLVISQFNFKTMPNAKTSHDNIVDSVVNTETKVLQFSRVVYRYE